MGRRSLIGGGFAAVAAGTLAATGSTVTASAGTAGGAVRADRGTTR